MSNNEELIRFCTEQKIPFRQDQPMREYTTFAIGGPAKVMIEPYSVSQLQQVMRFCASAGLAPFFLGRGSDLLVNDNGIRRPVIRLAQNLCAIERKGNSVICQAGASLTGVCEFAQQNGLSGLEFAYGIPGNVGGAVYMNAGAYGGEIRDVTVRVTHVAPNGGLQTIGAKACEFGYRHSVYSKNNCCIVQVEFALKPHDPEEILARMQELMARRREKQPLEYPSGGSTFKRPAKGYAAALIDECGLKGRRVGGAMVSEKHAGFVINYDHATCAEVQSLIDVVQREVWQKTGIKLECEVQYVGD